MRFDIFCRVIDNYGDIGVCWRLARQLASRSPAHHVTLWVDDIERFQRIEPAVRLLAEQALSPSISVLHWQPDMPARQPADVVIEAFACDPPGSFLRAMAQSKSLWINLEYLSAESWVDGCHGLPSLQPNGLKKYFFFPGFTPSTGGLLREDGLLEKRRQWLRKTTLRTALLRRLGVPHHCIEGLQCGWRQAMLFGYPNTPVQALTSALEESATPWVVLVPRGMHPDALRHTGPKLHCVEIPFVTQDEFDQLLWSSDLNFVRGEDSVLRALWAGKPLVWHIYPQDENAHLTKLQAWLERSPFPVKVRQLIMAWNTGDAAVAGHRLFRLLDGPDWVSWQDSSTAWCEQLANQPGLAQNLDDFCAKNR